MFQPQLCHAGNIVSELTISQPIVPIVHSVVTDAPPVIHEHSNSAVDAHCVLHSSHCHE